MLNKLRVKKENQVYTIDESQKQYYQRKGFEVICGGIEPAKVQKQPAKQTEKAGGKDDTVRENEGKAEI